MDTMCYKEQLEEFMLLHNKSALDANEEARRSCLCTSLNEESFCESVLELLDHDNTLTGQILNYLYSSGYNIEQVVFGGIAIGLYLLIRLLPEDGELIGQQGIHECGYGVLHLKHPSQASPFLSLWNKGTNSHDICTFSLFHPLSPYSGFCHFAMPHTLYFTESFYESLFGITFSAMPPPF